MLCEINWWNTNVKRHRQHWQQCKRIAPPRVQSILSVNYWFKKFDLHAILIQLWRSTDVLPVVQIDKTSWPATYAKTVDPRDAKFHTLTKQGQTIHMHRSPIPIPKVVGPKAQFFTLVISAFQLFGRVLQYLPGWLPTTTRHPQPYRLFIYRLCPSVDDIVLLSAFCHGLQKLVNIL